MLRVGMEALLLYIAVFVDTRLCLHGRQSCGHDLTVSHNISHQKPCP
jgi:hypothetical protein